MSSRPLPPEIKAANRARALELVAERGDRPMTPEFAAAMRTVFLPAYRQVLEEQSGVPSRRRVKHSHHSTWP
ncbi:hypothetical protein [Gordonia rubripertincta]|uniref:hypothetical protein n=1 Tax=Gordonia rubripertincta TaxID=36822 RepID=UPI0015FCBC91|nr:hypothetical protein [Gordonia rubripertincta]QMU22883.1 hypothetical protein H3V45_10635 [Gordonia rubripertincta]